MMYSCAVGVHSVVVFKLMGESPFISWAWRRYVPTYVQSSQLNLYDLWGVGVHSVVVEGITTNLLLWQW